MHGGLECLSYICILSAYENVRRLHRECFEHKGHDWHSTGTWHPENGLDAFLPRSHGAGDGPNAQQRSWMDRVLLSLTVTDFRALGRVLGLALVCKEVC